MQVKEGSLWSGGDKKFRVLGIVVAEGHTWVHYRDELKGFDQSQAREYSCYEESFVQRFRQLPE